MLNLVRKKKQEQLQREKDEIEAERNRLLSLDDKALKVEFILAMKGLYGKIESLCKKNPNLCERKYRRQGRVMESN